MYIGTAEESSADSVIIAIFVSGLLGAAERPSVCLESVGTRVLLTITILLR